ncbi:hypothetical protein HAX54_044402 [Datura stramonium]|uniref:Uncharacterized protein n=1 Tax=Datura stramonium TaxID=4076 RepID=A0ABS8WIG6_DATST|nr:hypothetical protein [Datura stramonium]
MGRIVMIKGGRAGDSPFEPSGPFKRMEVDTAVMRELLRGLTIPPPEDELSCTSTASSIEALQGTFESLAPRGRKEEEAIAGQGAGVNVEGNEEAPKNSSSPLEAFQGLYGGRPEILLPQWAQQHGVQWGLLLNNLLSYMFRRISFDLDNLVIVSVCRFAAARLTPTAALLAGKFGTT